jgi:hypothetical protein
VVLLFCGRSVMDVFWLAHRQIGRRHHGMAPAADRAALIIGGPSAVERHLSRYYTRPTRPLSNSYTFSLTFLASIRPSATVETEETRRSRHLEIKMPVYHAYIVGLHSRSNRVVQMDRADDDSAIKSAGRLVDGHDVELWQTDRPIARFEAPSKQIFKS